MAISDHVRSQLFQETQLIRIPQTRRPAEAKALPATPRHGTWTASEHAKFLEALALFPAGPWRKIAAHVGSKTARQAMTHGQKYRQKIARRQRGLKKLVRDMGDDVNAPPQENEECTASPDMSNDALLAFAASLDFSVDPTTDPNTESPLFVPDVPTDMPALDDFSLDATTADVQAAPVEGEALTDSTLEMSHLAAMLRADVASDDLSPLLESVLRKGAAEPEVDLVSCQLPEDEAFAKGQSVEAMLLEQALWLDDEFDANDFQL